MGAVAATQANTVGEAGQPVSPEFSVPLGRYDRSAVMEEVRALSQVHPWRSVGLIAAQWGIVVLAMVGAIWVGQWWAYLLAVVVIGTRQQAMGVLVHDAAHWLLFKHRGVNDVVSDLFLAFPMGLSTTLYRETHFRHHRYTSTDGDPDWVWQQGDWEWQWPKTKGEVLRLVLVCLFGLNLHRAVKVARTWSPGANLFTPLSKAYPLRARLMFLAMTPVMYAVAGWGLYTNWRVALPVILLWMLPFLTVFNLLGRVRATAEHLLAPCTHELNSSRTVKATWLERLLVAPLGINYHIEHHLFPSVPGPDLPKLHARLMQDEAYREQALVAESYWNPRRGLMGELLSAPERASGG